jgi:transcriptional regulator with XRE-family HTH domain
MKASNLIKSYRMANRVSQEELGAIVHVTGSMVSQYENGLRPSVAVAKRIARVAGFDWTLFYEDIGREDGAR